MNEGHVFYLPSLFYEPETHPGVITRHFGRIFGPTTPFYVLWNMRACWCVYLRFPQLLCLMSEAWGTLTGKALQKSSRPSSWLPPGSPHGGPPRISSPSLSVWFRGAPIHVGYVK